MARVLLFGFYPSGEQRSEMLSDESQDRLRELAEARLSDFESVEVWVESVCVVRLRRPAGT